MTATSEPSALETPAPSFEVIGLPSVSELEISAEQTDEAVAQNIVAVFSAWGMAGASKEMKGLRDEGENGYLSMSDYVEKISDEINPVYTEAVYGANATNPEFSEAIELKASQNREILTVHFQTYGINSAAAYYQKLNFISIDSVIDNGDGTKTISVTVEREDNGDANIVNGSGDGLRMDGTFVVAATDGVIHLAQPAKFTDK